MLPVLEAGERQGAGCKRQDSSGALPMLEVGESACVIVLTEGGDVWHIHRYLTSQFTSAHARSVPSSQNAAFGQIRTQFNVGTKGDET